MTNGRVEVITSVERRRRWSVAEKRRLVAAALEPGASVSAIAREAGIHPGQLYGWRRQLVRRRLCAGAGHSGLVTVRSRPRGRPVAFALGDHLAQIFHAVRREGDGLLVVGIVDPETAVLRAHVGGHFPEQLLILAEDFGSVADRDRVTWCCHGQSMPSSEGLQELSSGGFGTPAPSRRRNVQAQDRHARDTRALSAVFTGDRRLAHGHDQVECSLAFGPGKAAAVLVQHHALATRPHPSSTTARSPSGLEHPETSASCGPVATLPGSSPRSFAGPRNRTTRVLPNPDNSCAYDRPPLRVCLAGATVV